MNAATNKLLTRAGFDVAALERMGLMPQVEKFVGLMAIECVLVGADAYNDDADFHFFPGDAILQHFGVKQ